MDDLRKGSGEIAAVNLRVEKYLNRQRVEERVGLRGRLQTNGDDESSDDVEE